MLVNIVGGSVVRTDLSRLGNGSVLNRSLTLTSSIVDQFTVTPLKTVTVEFDHYASMRLSLVSVLLPRLTFVLHCLVIRVGHTSRDL